MALREPRRLSSGGRWLHLRERLAAVLALRSRSARLLLGLGVALLCAALVTPGLVGQKLPVDDEDLGTPAEGDIKAPRDFEIPDLETTEHKRVEAAEQVPSVYDFDTHAAMEVEARVHAFFTAGRAALGKIAASEAPIEIGVPPSRGEGETAARGATVPRAQAGDPPEDEPQAAAAAAAAEVAARIVTRFLEGGAGVAATLGVTVAEADLRILAEDGFSREAEAALAGLIRPALGQAIVADREFLAAEVARGLTLRRVPDRERGDDEKRIKDPTRLADVAAARQELSRTGTDLLGRFPEGLRDALLHVARALVRPTLTINRVETERRKTSAAESVKPVVLLVRKGEMIVRDGERISPLHLAILRGMEAQGDRSDRAQMLVGVALFVFLLCGGAYRVSRRSVRKFHGLGRDLMMMALVLAGMLVLVKGYGLLTGALHESFSSISPRTFYYLVPVAAGAMVVRLLGNAETALIFAPVASLLFGLLAEANLGLVLYAYVGSVVGIDGVARASRRRTLIAAGLLTGLANGAVVLGLAMFQGTLISTDTLVGVSLGLAAGLTAGVVVTGTAPILESLFGYTTDVQLLELANLNHPLLKELIVQAPGTYHHSIVVGSLVEAAAEQIHSNPLLARVAAYYHDIGKIRMPMYFSENQRDAPNRHDKLAPSMSALIIVNHVKEGVEMARAYGLPAPIQDIIGEHHGQSLIKYFYQKALDQEGGAVDEKEFRYPGPKPQTREAALVMLADAVEASAKSIAQPTEARLTGLVQKTINRFFTDGQLGGCELTLKDLHEIAKAFNRVLVGMYHHRVDYPEPATKERGERRDKEKPPDADKDQGPPPPAPEEVDLPEDDGGEDLKRLGMS